MSSTTMTPTQSGFAAEVAVLAQILASLGQYRFLDQREEFEDTLTALGMEPSEVPTYWDWVDDRVGTGGDEWRTANSNKILANCFGIRLKPGVLPRQWLLYRLVQLHFPDLLKPKYQRKRDRVDRITTQADQLLVIFEQLPVDRHGQALPLYKVLQGQEPEKFQPQVLRAAGPLVEALGDQLGRSLAELLLDLQMLIPDPIMSKLLARVIRAGQAGEEVVVVGAFCPDYAYRVTGNPQIPYRYTFDGVGDGVGLVAQQFVRIVPRFSEFLRKLGIRHRIMLSIGDFEADSDDVLRRVGLDRTEFLRRCRASLDAFRAQMPPGLPLTLEMFGEERSCGRFRSYADEATAAMKAGDFRHMRDVFPDLDGILRRIPAQYGTFYDRWYGRLMTPWEVLNLVLNQGGEYAGLTRIYWEDFGPNVLTLAGDRPEMHRFNNFWCPEFPTLCAKRTY